MTYFKKSIYAKLQFECEEKLRRGLTANEKLFLKWVDQKHLKEQK